jgi:uncharacterized protein YjbI with pentapeptide repeats
MPNYIIKSAVADTILYAGNFRNFTQCIEAAVQNNISLQGADLRQANLLNAELDGGDFNNADFTGANLCGANLSEANLRKANFNKTILHGTVLCESDLTAATFKGALFGATEIAGAILQDCTFSTLSAFDLRFEEAGKVSDCRFINPCNTVCPFSRQPLVLHGLNQFAAVMDRHIKVGHNVFELNAIPNWIVSGGLNPRNMRIRLEQIVLALMMDDKSPEIA